MEIQTHNKNSSIAHHSFTNLSDRFYNSEQEEQSGIISDEFLEYAVNILFTATSGTFSLCGIVFNAINIIVFLKQGFADSVNISLFALTIADMGTVFFTFIQSICYGLWVNEMVDHINFRHLQYATAAWPRGTFLRLSAFITAYISFERCLCIMVPLKVKAILTRRLTLTVITFLYVLVLSGFIVVYSSIKLENVFSRDLNQTILSLVYINGKESIQMEKDFLLSQSLYQITAFILIWVFTLTLVFKMKSKSKWRESTLTSSQAESMSTRDRKVIKMVLLISSTFIVCNTPSTIQMAAMHTLSVYGVTGVYRNMYVFAWSVCCVFDTICASVNIFFYYRMSSKYSAILDTMMPETFKKCLRNSSTDEGKKQVST